MRSHFTFWSCLSARRCCALLALSLSSACGDEKDGAIPAPVAHSSSPAAAPDAEVVAECDQAADGTPCGERGRDMHCLFNVCVRNACGDGIRTEDEECDDGNERDGDGCSERCMFEKCGNGALDLGEDCDDGNNVVGDGCAARCRVERCGNRVIDPGEECDDGNARDDDICSSKCKTQLLKTPDAGAAEPGTAANPGDGTSVDSGTSVMDAGGSGMDASVATDTDSATDTGGPITTEDTGGPIVTIDAGPPPLNDQRSSKCKACMEGESSPCRDYQGTGVDVIAGCFNATDAAASKKCADAFFCSLNAGDLCGGDLTRGPLSCYCGLNRTKDDCEKAPSATTGPIGLCIPQWEAAAGCAPNGGTCVGLAMVDLTKPSSYANFIVGCAVNDCAADCWGPEGLIRDPDAGTPDSGAADASAPPDAASGEAGP